jgi:acetyl-CoA C-acetyltransferase
MLASQSIKLKEREVIIAGGMESMSNAPYYLTETRFGTKKLGDTKTIDGMIKDGLWDPYNNFHMGNCAELCSKKYSISREGKK